MAAGWERVVDKAVLPVLVRSWEEDRGRRHAVGSDRGCANAEDMAASRFTMKAQGREINQRPSSLLQACMVKFITGLRNAIENERYAVLYEHRPPSSAFQRTTRFFFLAWR